MIILEIAQPISDWWSWLADIGREAVENFASSTFVTALLASLAGAFAGAITAQRIAERGKLREELVREVRNTNVAITLAWGTCNSLLQLKGQHVKGLKERYEAQNFARLEFIRMRDAGEIPRNVPFEFQADMLTIQAPALPIDMLRAVVFERISVIGRPLSLVATLTQTVHSLADALAKRSTLVDGDKVEFAKNTQGLMPLYFGLPYGGGDVNLEFPDTINNIHSATDNAIFFSQLLCKDLSEHGKQLSDRFKKKFKKDSPRISSIDFAKAEAEGLMPDQKNYPDWFSAFAKKD